MLGERFGRLVVLEPAESSGSHKKWLCRCDCGQEVVVWQMSLRRGTTASCGCAKDDALRARWQEYRGPAFWERVQVGDLDQCWPWLGLRKQSPKNTQPYGMLGWNGKSTSAHRVAYELVNGEIANGAMVLHTCDFGLCCNPSHLYLGDHAQNMRDVIERNRRSGIGAGADNGRSKLTQAQADAIRARYATGGVSQQSLADEHGISQNAISKIVRGQRYK